MTPPKTSDNIIRVSVTEAARLFGIDTKTIRRAIQKQELRYVVVRGRYKIHFGSLVKWSQERTKIRNKLNEQGIGQYVSRWKIKNTLYSPNPNAVRRGDEKDEKKAS